MCGVARKYVCAHIHPFAGGLLAIVPAPSGIRAVGEGEAPDRKEFERELRMLGALGEVGEAVEVEAVEAGEMGFILKPLKPVPVRCGIGGWTVGGGPGRAERGVKGSIFSRWSWRYVAGESVGNAAAFVGLNFAGESVALGNAGKATA